MVVLFAGVPVADLRVAKPWYERLFGRPADVVPNDHEVMWSVATNGWVYVVEAAGPAGGGLITISVSDLDQFVAELAARGITAGPIEAVGDAGRKAVATDPDGTVVSFIELAPVS